jgi:phosphohistidine phosphatase
LHLWVLRHGEAHVEAATDAERRLTERGQADARAAGSWLAAAGQRPQRVLCSPYRRARETAQLVLESLPGVRLEIVDWLVPDSEPLTVVKHLSPLLGAVLLVSHQPLVGALVGVLADDDREAGPPLATAALAELDVPLCTGGWARLLSLRNPPDYSHSPAGPAA